MRNLLVSALLAVAAVDATAAPTPEAVLPAAEAGDVKVIAFEAPGCRYCALFRQTVLPTYAATRSGKTAPLEFLDVNAEAAQGLKLKTPITVVPTIVVMRGGAEVGRIDGYVDRASFHHLIDALLGPQ